MQILKRLFKVAQEEQATNTTPAKPKTDVTVFKEAEPKVLIFSKRRQTKVTEGANLTYKVPHSFRITARAFFYHSLNLKRLGSFRGKQHCTFKGKEKGFVMGHKVDSAVHVGNKVSPISDATSISASTVGTYQCWSSEKIDDLKGDKNKAISRMKELWKWAATAKSDKGGNYIRRKVLHFRNRGGLKASLQDDQWSLSSPKISFRWETESCSTTTSAYSAFSLPSSSKHDRKWSKPCSNNAAVDVVAPDSSIKDTTLVIEDNECSSRSGNWITTDDD
ncbi:hypothetical protein AQUCO_03400233v1, partial [Aquilegia coerulea]